jgi:hypothetical protein
MRKPYCKGHSCAVTAWESEKCWQWPAQLKRQGKDKLPEIKVMLYKILPDKEDTRVINKYWFRHIKTLDAHLLVFYIVYLNLTDMFHDNTKTVSQNFTTITAQKLMHKKSATCNFQCLSSWFRRLKPCKRRVHLIFS